MDIQFSHFYAQEAEQFSFYRIPKVLFTDDLFKKLSVEAKVLYGLMLDRMGLSLKSGWVDRENRVYIYFTLEDIQEYMGCGRTKATQLLKELDSGIGLIRRKRQGLGKPDTIYVMNFVTAHQSTEKRHSGQKSDENQQSRVPESNTLESRNPVPINTEKNETDFSDTESIHPISFQREKDSMDEMEQTKQKLKRQWGYHALLDTYTPAELDGLISLGADVLLTTKATIRVGRQELPSEGVKQRLLSLDLTHIDYVLECMQKNTSPIRNIRSYLLTALYNAPTTIDAYYGAMVARDMGKEVVAQVPYHLLE